MLNIHTAAWQTTDTPRPTLVGRGATNAETAMSVRKLAYLDLGLVRSLLSLGTSRERICSALNLTGDEFDYVRSLV